MKPYEITEEELKSLIDKTYGGTGTYNITPFDKVLIKEAQKKLLEYLMEQAKTNTIWATPTHIGVKGLSPGYLENILKDFGLGE